MAANKKLTLTLTKITKEVNKSCSNKNYQFRQSGHEKKYVLLYDFVKKYVKYLKRVTFGQCPT